MNKVVIIIISVILLCGCNSVDYKDVNYTVTPEKKYTQQGYLFKSSAEVDFIYFDSGYNGYMRTYKINGNSNYNNLIGSKDGKNITLIINGINITGNIEDEKLILNFPLSGGEIASLEFYKATINDYNIAVSDIKQNKLESEKINTANDLKATFNDQLKILKDRTNELNKKEFSYLKINEELNNVKTAYNKYIKSNSDDKNYEYSNVTYYISNVEYYYDDIKYIVNNIKSEITDLNKMIDDINMNLSKYEGLQGYKFENKQFYNDIDNCKKVFKIINSNADNYLKNGKIILDDAYKYKK